MQRCAPNDEPSRSECRVSIGPWLKASDTTFDRQRIKRPVNQPVFTFQNWRKRSFFVKLRLRLNFIQMLESFADQVSAGVGQTREQLRRSLAGFNLRSFL